MQWQQARRRQQTAAAAAAVTRRLARVALWAPLTALGAASGGPAALGCGPAAKPATKADAFDGPGMAVSKSCDAGPKCGVPGGHDLGRRRPPIPEPAPPSPSATGRGPRLIAIHGGSFMMGSRDPDEKPVHRVTVASFRLDETEVTVAQYRACVSTGECAAARSVDANPYCNWNESGKDSHPINCVSWSDASTFCGWAGKRLPTEEEWEYAARGSEGREYPWGSSEPADQLCWNRGESELGTCEVGSHRSGDTPQGIHDLAGNVWEWTASRFCPYDNANCSEEMRVVRGGCWVYGDAYLLRGAMRNTDAPSHRLINLGFRCAQ